MKAIWTLLILFVVAGLTMGQKGGVSGGAGCGDGTVPVTCPDVHCPSAEATSEATCDTASDTPSENTATPDAGVPTGDASLRTLPPCGDGWACQHKVYRDKQRLKCWCGKYRRNHNSDGKRERDY